MPSPEAASQAPGPGPRRAGTPLIAAAGTVISRPTNIIQATTEDGSISRLERDEHSVDSAHAAAAPNPPRIAIT